PRHAFQYPPTRRSSDLTHDVAVGPRPIVAAAPAVADEMVTAEPGDGRLQVAQARADARAFVPTLVLHVVAKERKHAHPLALVQPDRKSTRLNSSHCTIS